MIKKTALISSGVLLGGLTITFSTMFGIYYNKYENINNISTSMLDREITITIDLLDEGVEDITKVYMATPEERTLEELMLDHEEDFVLSEPMGTFGRMVYTIFNNDARYESGSWWQLTSKTYLEHFGSDEKDGPQMTEDFSLSVGAAGAHLLVNEEFIFIETAAS